LERNIIVQLVQQIGTFAKYVFHTGAY